MGQQVDRKDNMQGDQGGEGNYDASRRYREGLAQSEKKGNAEQLAEQAKKALEGPEGDALRAAEEKGKQAGKPAAPPPRH